ncbi:MAG: peptidoglycan-binding domain-containing protein [Acidobacteriota bacterium]
MLKRMLMAISVCIFVAAGICAQGTSATATTATTATKTEKAKKGPVFRPTKDQIKQVQTLLISKKLYSGEASGSYNDPTRTGIKNFQKDNGLKETGTLNRATLEKFGVALTDQQKTIPVSPNSFASADSSSSSTKTTSSTKSSSGGTKRPPPFRANSDQIKSAQKMLKDGKMYTGEETGKLDDATRDGLKKYQTANSLKVTGTLNSTTLDKMGIALTDAQKANVAAQAAYDAAKKN